MPFAWRGTAGRTTSRCSCGSSPGLQDREQHLASEDPAETDERRAEHLAHQEIQLSVIGSQRNAIIALRDAGEINDSTLRELERELDLEELRMEA